MTTAELYRKHKKGEISRDRFLYEVRRDSNLPWITNILSYDDAVKILKNKGIVSETQNTTHSIKVNDDPEFDSLLKKIEDKKAGEEAVKSQYDQPSKQEVKEGSYTDPDDETFTLHLVDYIEGADWGLTPDQLNAAIDYVEEHYYDLQGDFANNHEIGGGIGAAAKYVVNLVKSGEISEETEPARQPSKTKTITTAELLDIANKAGQIVIDAERELVQLGVAYGDRISMDAVNAILTNYDMSLEDLDDIEVQNNRDLSMDDLYDRGYMEEIALNEANANFEIEPDTSKILNSLNPYTVKAALNYELEKKPVVGDAEYQKLLMKIAKKLQKDPLAYEYVQFGNAKKVAKEDAKLQMTPIKDTNHKDTPNEMKKIKGHTDAKANTKVTKKENKKGSPKGVKIMKENVLEDLTSFLKKKIQLEGVNRYDYGIGTQVHTPIGEGAVTEVNGGTVTVQYEDGNMKDYQMNYLNNLREAGLSLDHYKEALEQCNWETPHPEDIKALTHTYSQLSDDDKANAKKEYQKILVNTKPGNETTDKVDALDAGAEFDGYNITPKEAPVKEDKKHQILKSLEELLFKKKNIPGAVTTSTDSKPVSLNPADPSDQAVMKDPQFRQKYQTA
jgi:hypothetical protein